MIKIQDVTFRYPKSDKEVLSRLNLEIADGEFLCIIGHSGCGKSTLLKLIAGLDMPTSGSVLTDNKTISGPSVERSVVFQQYSLFTAKCNILKYRHPRKQRILLKYNGAFH